MFAGQGPHGAKKLHIDDACIVRIPEMPGEHMISVFCIFGTRPEAIKMAPVIQELKKRHKHFLVRTCVTG